jgi:hypothetical protein
MLYFPAQNFPNELGEVIFDKLTVSSKMRYCPLVSKSWKAFCDKQYEVDKEQLIRSKLDIYPSESVQEFQDRISKTIEIISDRRLFFMPEVNKIVSAMSQQGKYFISREVKEMFSGPHEKVVEIAGESQYSSRCSQHFFVVWNPEQKNYAITDKGKWHDVRSSFYVREQLRTFSTDQAVICLQAEIICLDNLDHNAEVGGLFKWQPTSRESIKSTIFLIQGLVTANLLIYVEQLAKYNLCLIKELIKETCGSEDPQEAIELIQDISFNDKGIVVKRNDVTVPVKLVVRFLDANQKMATFVWTSIGERFADCDSLVFSVISKTTNLLNESFKNFGFYRK